VVASDSYDHLTEQLLSGAVQAAWAPPLVCARVEKAGGRVVVQGVRGGTASYRSVLFARRGLLLSTQALQGRTAAWTDRHSMGGYVLPTALLRGVGIHPDRVFAEQLFVGTYEGCVKAVLDGRAHVSGCYASSAAAQTARMGFLRIAKAHVDELTVLAYSGECPHDGIALSPNLSAEDKDGLTAAFVRLVENPEEGRALARALDWDGLKIPDSGTYQDLARYIGVSNA